MLQRIRRNKPASAGRLPQTIIEQVQNTLTQARGEEDFFAAKVAEYTESLAAAKRNREQTERIANALESIVTGETA